MLSDRRQGSKLVANLMNHNQGDDVDVSDV